MAEPQATEPRTSSSALQARLAERLAARRGLPRSTAIPRRPGSGPAPLSYPQERLWLVDRLAPGDSTYTIARALALRGPLDIPALQWAFDELARRHEALRTAFAGLPDGQGVQVIATRMPLWLRLLDLTALGDAARDEAEHLALTAAARPFDLERGPLLRASLLRLAPREHVLVLTIHHIVADGWSMEILYRELEALYGSAHRREPSPLAELPVQYADYALWQRGKLAGDKLEELLDVWRAALAEAPTATELPADRPRPPVQSFRGGLRTLAVGPLLADTLRVFAQDEGATPFMALLALWQTVVGRLAGRDDLVIGTPVAGRTRSELEGLIGFFVNTLPLRADLSDRPSFRQLLARVRRSVLAALQHQEVPFDKLVEALAPERDLARSPLVQVSFAFQERADNLPALSELEVERLAIDHVRSKFDFTLSASEGAGDIELEASYAADLFDGATAARALRQMRTLLAAALAAPECPLAELPLLAPEELQAVLREWNDTTCPWSSPATLHGLFAAQAARAPEAAALIYEAERLSYGEIEARANRLARLLRREGVGLETRVAVCLERSPELAVALLAVLKTGGAYVPLDPDFPRERLAFMLEDSGASFLLADPGAPELPLRGVRRLEIAAVAAAALAAESDDSPEDEVPSAALAYVLYTSGSTGRPKGVMVTHGAAANHLLWVQSAYALESADRVLLKTPISFDVSVRELFWPLSVGAAVVVARPGGQRDTAYLAELAAREGVTVGNFVPTLLAAFLDEPALAGATALRRVIAGGEALSAELVARFHHRLPTASLHNHYGPTETAVNATAWRCRPGEPVPIPIGWPIDNARVVLVDRAFQPVPIGVAGELWIGGAGVARGYSGRADATAERFVPDPFSGTPGARLYRTGDLARRRPDGVLEFLGRVDEQVKVRGVRIEPAEVEAALAAHHHVFAAAVAVKQDARGTERLVGYVVPRDGGAAPATNLDAELRVFLRERLPDAMIPSVFVALDTLPVGATGKLERRLLPDPGAEATVEEPPRSERDPVEELLAAVWAEVLGVERVRAADHFFELGGHSLAATRVVARVRQLLGVELPLRALFERPRLGELAERARAERRAAVEGVGAPLALVSMPRTGPLPLAFAQERLWVLQQLEGDGALYNLTLALEIAGPLDVRALAAALHGVVARHEALRTRFLVSAGQPLQEVLPAAPVRLRRVDLTRLDASLGEEALRTLTGTETRRPFDLAAGHPFRATLAQLAPERYALVVSMHHIVSDGWSLGVLLHELAALYDGSAAATSAEKPLPHLPVQYADFAVWQRDWLAGGPLASQLAWWRERLMGAPEVLALPTDRPRTPRRETFGGRHEVVLSPEVAAPLRTLGRREGATLFMTLSAIFAAFLARLGGGEDVPFGTPVANRGRRELEGLIGFFVNTLVLRADLSGDPPFRELLARLRETALEAYDRQDLPFERLVEELAPQRELSHQPLFQVLFTLETPPPTPPMAGLALRRFPVESGVSKFDLSLGFEERADGTLAGAFVYRRDLFDPATVARLARHFRTLAEGIALMPGARLWDLPVLTAEERLELTFGRNRQTSEFPRERCVHELVAEQAARRPDAVALEWQGGVVTYGELTARANQLARRLRRLGVGAETRVGVCLERSPELVIALLGVLAAGGAYLPLDPDYPAERLATMLEDGEVTVLVTVERLLGVLPPHAARALCLDREREALAGESALPLEDVAAAESLAYVLYTSGSTGRPKGVAVTHRGIARLVKQDAFGDLGQDEVFLLLAPIPFDASTFEIWGPLANGARLVVFPPHTPSLEELGEALARHGVTTLFLTSGLFHQMAEAQLPALLGMRQLLTGGDVLSAPHARRVLDRLDHGTLVNAYGPTENTTFTTCHVMRAGAAFGGAVPIGRPIAHTRVFLLDRALRPVPEGVPGELYTGGDGLARGYLNRPDLTADRFVPDPVSDEPGERLYRTGDLARWLPDGTIEFLGRVDRQVKLRGFRIEPGEIETLLASQPEVRAAVVVVREVAGRGKELVAYVVPREPGQEIAASLRERLRAGLPTYMVPTCFVALDALPLDRNGKVDRRALPEPPSTLLEEGGPAAPRTPAEELLAGIWAEVLGVEPIGLHDGFFDLGGHSLLAMRVVSRVRSAFGVELPLRRLFERPTVAGLAADIDAELRRGGAPGGEPERPLAPAPRAEELPLSFAQERLWFLDGLEPGNAALHIGAPVRVRGALDPERLERALAGVVERHEALRTRFPARGGRPRQAVEPAVRCALRMVDLRPLPDRTAREAEAARRATAEKAAPFDLAHGPLLRGALLRLDDEEHLLLLTVHHIVADGWSLGILLRELAALYAGEELPPLPVQYADFAVWQRERLAGDELARQVGYWRERLSGAPPLLELPLDHPRPPVQTFHGAVYRQRLATDLTTEIHALGRREGTTLFMTLLAGLSTLLGRLAGQEDVCVGAPVAGRGRAEIEGLIGCFLNTLVLRADLSGAPSFRALLARARETTLGAFAHQDLPFEKLLEELQPQRTLAHTPLFQVFLNVLNFPAIEARLPGLALELQPPQEVSAKFDLTLYVEEVEGVLRIDWVYNADLFDATRIEEMARQLASLLTAGVADPGRPIATLPLLTPEAACLLPDPAATLDATWHGAVPTRFAELAARAPELPAVSDAVESWSYGELATYVHRLARRLTREGVGKGEVVALWGHRSAPLVAGLLATLESGAAFVVLDPAYPTPRLAETLRLARPKGFLAVAAAGPVPEAVRVALEEVGCHCRLVLPPKALLAARDPAADEPGEPPEIALGPDDLAYIAFTSGSTGVPKGILGRHGSLSHFIPWQRERYGFGEGDRFSLLSGLAHDPLHRDVFTPLQTGGSIAIPDPERLASPGYLAEWLRREGVTVANLTPAMGQLLADGGGAGRLPKLRLAFVVGDILTRSDVRRLHELAPGLVCVNHYGSTETQRAVGYHVVPGGAAADLPEVLPLGRGIPDVQLLVVSPAGQLAGIGEVGEIWVRSPHVALGYLGEAERTAERFVVNPWTDDPADRAYRTGDLGRYAPDGDVTFAGRADQQVKVRGFRIELGEIESVLGRHENVREAAVVARGEGTDRRLVAYVAPAARGVEVAELRAFLRERLPDYMLPAAYVLLEALPLTPNGKLDRRALPAPPAEGASGELVAPRTLAEEMVVEIWREVLRRDRIGVHDDFFDLGGHSLLATQVLARIEEAFGAELPVRTLFECSRLEQFALAVEAALVATLGEVPAGA